jgi:hypothetical protein
MSHLPTRWKKFIVLLTALLALTFLVGCQGFSAAKSSSSSPGTQGTTGNPLPGDLVAAPASVSFGNVQIGTSQTLSDTLTNSGGTTLNITQATVTGSGFSDGGLNLPLSLAPGASVIFSVIFTPTSAGSANGNIEITDDASTTPLEIALSGTAGTAGSLAATPTSLNFGSVQVGSQQSETETLTNTGGEDLTISQANTTGAGFSFTGLSLPFTLAPNQIITFGVSFTPALPGAANGDLSLTVSGSSTTVDVALSGTGTPGVTAATLVAVPASLTFNSVQTGKSQAQTEMVQNNGGTSATISGVTTTGTGFSISGLSTPLTLAPGQTISFSVTFAPQSTGTFNGNVAIASDASNPTLNIGLTGTAVGPSQGQLSVSPTTINVGNVTVGTSGTQTGMLNATTASVVLSSVNVGSSEFEVSGLSFPVTIAAGQSANFTVTFTPQSSGLASSTISFISNASNSPSSATVTGTGVAAPVHSVNLSWNADNSPNVIGYNIYRRIGTTGTFDKINTALDAATTFTDTAVTDGDTYYYETTAINSSQEESAPSTAVQAVIPPL